MLSWMASIKESLKTRPESIDLCDVKGSILEDDHRFASDQVPLTRAWSGVARLFIASGCRWGPRRR